MTSKPFRTRAPATLLPMLLATALGACGGGESEPEVTVYTSLPHGADYRVVPGSAGQIQADLRQRGIAFSNPRCADWQRYVHPVHGGSGWIEGIPPVYLVLQVPESSMAKLDALFPHHYHRDPDKNPEIVQPYFDCAGRGF